MRRYRTQQFAGLGGPAARRGDKRVYPSPLGTPGSFIFPYNENKAWGETGAAVGPPPPAVIPIPSPTPGAPPTDVTIPNPNSMPWSGTDKGWQNPTTFAAVPISVATAGATLTIFTANAKRNFLLVQNNCISGGTGDVTPIFFINFNQAALSNLSLALPAGQGIAFDVICPRDSVTLLMGTFTNTSGLMIFGGVAIQGTYAP